MSTRHSSKRSSFFYHVGRNVVYRRLDFLGLPGYRVGDDGSVWSKWTITRKDVGRGSKAIIGKVWRRMRRANKGHHYCFSFKDRDGKVKWIGAHRLVLFAFVGPCPPGMECCHFPDRDPTNNNLMNLKWGTDKENQDHRRTHGTGNQGENNPSAKLTMSIVRRIREIHKLRKGVRGTQAYLSRKFKLHPMTISNIIHRKIWNYP